MHNFSVISKLEREQSFSILGIKPPAKVTFKKATVHPLIDILTSRQGYVSEFFIVSHCFSLLLGSCLILPVISSSSFWFLIHMV